MPLWCCTRPFNLVILLIYIIPQKPSTLISLFISASSSLSISLCAFVKYPTRLRLGFKQVNSKSYLGPTPPHSPSAAIIPGRTVTYLCIDTSGVPSDENLIHAGDAAERQPDASSKLHILLPPHTPTSILEFQYSLPPSIRSSSVVL